MYYRDLFPSRLKSSPGERSARSGVRQNRPTGVMESGRLCRAGLLCASALASISGAPAWAQDVPDSGQRVSANQSDAAANEIVVTGSRRETKLQNSPINITAITPETLERQQIDSIRQLSAFTPGLTAIDTGPALTGKIILRGINSGDTTINSELTNSTNSVGVYLGEVPLYLDFKLIDIQRVEVLEGPQGTLYGLGTLAGAVRYIPNRPTADAFTVDLHARGYAESHSSDFGGSGDVAINVPIVKDHIAFRTSTGYYRDAGFIDYDHLLQTPGISNPQPARGVLLSQNGFGTPADYAANFRREKDLNYDHTLTSRNQLLLQYNPDLKVYLTYAHQDTKTGGQQVNARGVLGSGRYEAPFRFTEPYERRADLYSAEIYASLFGIAQLVSATEYTKQKLTNTQDNTDLLLDLNYGYEAFPNFSSYADIKQSYKQFNQELRLVSTHGGPINWVIGAFYNDLKYSLDRVEFTPGYANFLGVNRPDDLEFVQAARDRTKEKAVYGEATLHITKAWQVTGGIRYFKYSVHNNAATAVPLFGIGIDPYPATSILPSRYLPVQAGSDGVVWKANTSYKVNENLLAYATYSTGYRVGGANSVVGCTPEDLQRAAAGGQVLCALPNEQFFGPDKTSNAEIGVRAALFDRRLQFTLDGYHINWNSLQVPSTTVFGEVGIIKNAGAAISKGVEFTGTLKVTPRFVIQGTYAYNDAHLTKTTPGLVVVHDPSLQIAGEAGDRLPGSTKNSGSIQGTYTFPLANDRAIEANWTTTYTGDIYSRVGLRGFGTVVPSYVTHHASLTYRTKKFDVSLFADNIFDKYAVTSVSTDQSSINRIRDAFGSVKGQGVVERFYLQSLLTPRRVGLEFRFHY